MKKNKQTYSANSGWKTLIYVKGFWKSRTFFHSLFNSKYTKKKLNSFVCQTKQRQCHIQNKPEIFGAFSDSRGEMLVFLVFLLLLIVDTTIYRVNL